MLPADLVKKLDKTDLLPVLDTLPRNLGALLGQKAHPA
jgi:hypothetical protein